MVKVSLTLFGAGKGIRSKWNWMLLLTIFMLLMISIGIFPRTHSAHASPTKRRAQPAAITQPPWSAYGTVIASIDNIPVYSNGGNVNNMQPGPYGSQYQCVELIQRYFALKWNYPNIWGGVNYAKQMMENHPNTDRYGNSQPINAIWNPASSTSAGSWPGPQRGDALVFDAASDGSNIAGHVALVTDVSGGNVYFVEQNFSRYGEDFLPIASNNYISPRGVFAVRGWLHASVNNGSGFYSTRLGFQVSLPGISNVGSDNNNPLHPIRTLTVTTVSTSNQTSTFTGSVLYNNSKGIFEGDVDLGSNWSSGLYQVKVMLPNTLRKIVPGNYFAYIYNLVTKGVTSYLYEGTTDPTTNRLGLPLVSGDLNNDNQLDILDYNILISCYGSKQCPPDQKAASDLNSDGAVDGVDYNIWLRNFQGPHGGD